MARLPPERRGRGCNILMLLILLLLVGGLAFWGWLRNPPATPNPAATGAPAGVPGG